MLKLRKMVALAMVASPAVMQAQLTGSGCFMAGYETCAEWSLTNPSGNLWDLSVKNTSTVASQKFGELYVFIGSGTPTVNVLSTDPEGWTYGGEQNPSSSLWFNGVLGQMGDNVQYLHHGNNFIEIGMTGRVSFTLDGTNVAPVGVGVHSQPSEGFESQRVRFGETSVVPEPSTYALVAMGLAGVFGVARRRQVRG